MGTGAFSISLPFSCVLGLISSMTSSTMDLLQDFFKGKHLFKGINPDEAIAYGAAIQATIFSEGFNNVPNLVLQDVNPLSLGIAVSPEEIMVVVIPRNTNIPVICRYTIFDTHMENISELATIYPYVKIHHFHVELKNNHLEFKEGPKHIPHYGLLLAEEAVRKNVVSLRDHASKETNMNESNSRGAISRTVSLQPGPHNANRLILMSLRELSSNWRKK